MVHRKKYKGSDNRETKRSGISPDDRLTIANSVWPLPKSDCHRAVARLICVPI